MLLKQFRVGHETSDEDLIDGGISPSGWDPHAGVSHTEGSLGTAHSAGGPVGHLPAMCCSHTHRCSELADGMNGSKGKSKALKSFQSHTGGRGPTAWPCLSLPRCHRLGWVTSLSGGQL